jgi:hypothetical protein
MSSSQTAEPTLLKLPAEVRLRIYAHVFDERTIFKCGTNYCKETVMPSPRNQEPSSQINPSTGIFMDHHYRVLITRSALSLTCRLTHKEVGPFLPHSYTIVCCHNSDWALGVTTSHWKTSSVQMIKKLVILHVDRGLILTPWIAEDCLEFLPAVEELQLRSMYHAKKTSKAGPWPSVVQDFRNAYDAVMASTSSLEDVVKLFKTVALPQMKNHFDCVSELVSYPDPTPKRTIRVQLVGSPGLYADADVVAVSDCPALLPATDEDG